jgi:DNA-binding MarR family transcriptional regulator
MPAKRNSRNRLQSNSALFNILFMTTKRPAPRSRDSDTPRLDEQLCFTLYSTSLAMNKLYRKLLGPLDVTYPQYLVLMVLWEQDGMTVSEIGDRLFLDSATLTPLLKRMEAAGMLTRVRAAADERQVVVTLTESGQALREKARALPEAVLCATSCSPEELQKMKAQLDGLRVQLAENM